ncbi:MAG: TatD family hydrolase [Steroidobacterales bacterium]
MELIDIGVNLGHDSFAVDRTAVIARARAAGVVQMIVTGSTLGSSEHALTLAQEHPGELYATAGVHPHHASELTPAQLPQLRALLQQPQVVAVGECGLDYYRNFSPQSAQRQAFELQLALAVDAHKPVFLHQREAHADFIAVLREYRRDLSGAVAHCFTSTERELEDYLQLGLAIGLTGWICDERRGAHLKTLAAKIPADRLMLETDAPYLLPRDLLPKPKSRRNEPMYLAHIAGVIAQARAEPVEDCAARCSANARAFFRLRNAPLCEDRA